MSDNMRKITLGKKMPPLAMPICLVGANVGGKPNFCTIAWFTMIDDEPPMIGLVMAKERRTKDGIMENRTFSVNLPSTAMAAATDHCGLVSGRDVDKSDVFKVFYGELGSAPLIEESPVSMECRLSNVVEFETTDLMVGEVVQVHVDASVVPGGKIDYAMLDPLLYASGSAYHSLGEKKADAFKVGRNYRKK
ncbi:flavin reductase family protein [Methanomassiliicoccus luminyensis]|uniref:flavin reductase family protein n=1 Tax=Methanomassiliicoccus luminyensis TaxID=1080712 RepID=UPI00191EBE89|nr:flavin reductase family protein [Methanomassiliicoccus luminyensis]